MFKKILLWFLLIFNLVSFYLLNQRIDWFWFLITAILIVNAVFFIFVFNKFRKTKGWWFFLFFYLLFLVTAILFFSILDSLVIKYLFILLVVGLSSYFLFLLNFYFKETEKYQPFSIVNLSEIFIFLIYFWLATGLLALSIFLFFSIWLAGLIFSVVSFLLVMYYFWINDSENLGLSKEKVLEFLVYWLLSAELYILVSFLPCNFYLSSFLLAFVLSVYIFERFNLKQKKVKRIIYILIFVLLLIQFLTTRWF